MCSSINFSRKRMTCTDTYSILTWSYWVKVQTENDSKYRVGKDIICHIKMTDFDRISTRIRQWVPSKLVYDKLYISGENIHYWKIGETEKPMHVQHRMHMQSTWNKCYIIPSNKQLFIYRLILINDGEETSSIDRIIYLYAGNVATRCKIRRDFVAMHKLLLSVYQIVTERFSKSI